MWFFDWFKTYFGKIEEKFKSIAYSIKGVPFLGEYLSYPFDSIAIFFTNLKTASGYASRWCDETERDITNTWNSSLNWVNELWRETDLIWRRIGAIPVLTYDVVKRWVTPWLENVKIYAENLVSNAIYSFDRVIRDINKDIDSLNFWIDNSSYYFNTFLDKSKDKVLEWIEDSFILILEKVMEHEKK